MRIDDAILSGSVLGSSAVVSITGSFTGSGHIETSSYAVTSSKVWITNYPTSEPTASSVVYIVDTDYEDPGFTPDPQTLYLIYEL
jgi:hypothetical protein